MEWPAAVARLAALFPDDELRGQVQGRLAVQPHFERFFSDNNTQSRAALLALLALLPEAGGQLATKPDDSMAIIRDNLWKVPEPQLPTTSQQVTQWMFGQQSLRIPVISLYYEKAQLQLPELAPQYLIAVNHAEAAIPFSSVLRHQPAVPTSSEMNTSTLVVSSIQNIWAELAASPKPLMFSLSLNRSEKGSSHSSRAQKAKKRPDTMVVVHKCTLLLGEDKHEDLQSAFRDLRGKRATLLRVHYRAVQFLVGYAAAGTSFQWCFLHAAADKEIELVGPLLDLRLPVDRWKFLLSWVQAYRLLTVMSEHLAPLQGHLALYDIIDRGDGRQVQMLGDCIRKTIADFNKQASDLHTSFDAVCEAYEVANAAVAEGIRALGQPYLITSKIAPSIDRRGCYTVTTTPCGYEAEVNTEQDLHAMAVTCCYAARALHSKGFVHRDLRLANLVQLGPQQFIVIDLESAARISQDLLPQDFSSVLRTCTSSALDEARCFTTASDMYLIGRLLEDAMLCPSNAAAAFINSLLHKSLSADQALHHLQHVWLAPGAMQM